MVIVEHCSLPNNIKQLLIAQLTPATTLIAIGIINQLLVGCCCKPFPTLVQVRTQTLVKNAIIQIDATPFRQWYSKHYGVEVGMKKKVGAANVAGDEKQVSEFI